MHVLVHVFVLVHVNDTHPQQFRLTGGEGGGGMPPAAPPPLRFGPSAAATGAAARRKPAATGAGPPGKKKPQRKQRKQEAVTKFSLVSELQDPETRKQWEKRTRYVESGRMQSWLQLGPKGVGCKACARHYAREGHSSRNVRPSKWCNFAVRPAPTAFQARQDIERHAATRSH